jgi:lysophospholipid acyltransferase (LPLAT)-like uncharacterized protein
VTKFYKTPTFRAAAAWVAAQYEAFAVATQRWTLLGHENLRVLLGEAPVIAVFWHETLPATLILWTIARREGMTRPAVALASAHQDGQLIGQVVRHHGLGLVSGSTSKGGAKALRELLHALAGGSHVVITPDGPRGPRRRAAPGLVQLAALSGARILPCAALTSRAVTLKSWDAMRLPVPFGRGALAVGEPIAVPRDGWQAALPQVEAALNALMDQAAAAL